jgi:DNA-binding response OmpR family regulator
MDGGKKRVMLVDDDEHLLQTLGDALEHGGYEVLRARSGEEALQELATQSADVIILDVCMPGIGGVGFLKQISDGHSATSIPILVHTVRAATESFFEGLQVAGFLAKPSPYHVVRARVEAILDGQSEAIDHPTHEWPDETDTQTDSRQFLFMES